MFPRERHGQRGYHGDAAAADLNIAVERGATERS